MGIFHTKKQLFAIFLPGAFFGFLYVRLIAKSCAGDTGIFTDAFLGQYGALELVPKDFLLYLLSVRLIPFVVLLCLMFTNLRRSICILAQIWTGFTCGALVTGAVLRRGLFGAVLCAAGIFPQFLMYIPAYLVIIWYGYTFPSNRWNAEKTFFVFITIMSGIFLEAYVNPPFMRFIIRALKII